MAEKKREGFNFYLSYFDVFNQLQDDKDKVEFIKALLEKQFYGVEPNLIGMSKFAYVSQKYSIDKQIKGWEDKTKCKLTPPLLWVENNPTRHPYQQVQEKGEVQGEEKEKVKEEEEKPLPKKTEKVFSEEVVNCFDECLVFFSEQLKPKNKTPWLDTIEKLNRIDNLHFSEITELVKKIRTDDFWVKNFQTITKLRSKNSDGISYHVYFTERFKHNTSSYKNNKNESKVHSNR